MHIDPYAIDIRYTLGLMAQQLHAAQPRTVRIASYSAELVKAAVRQLCCSPIDIFVETAAIQAEVRETLGVDVAIGQPAQGPADAALFPFSLGQGAQPAGEHTIIAAFHNALSYKSIVQPGRTAATIFGQLARLKSDYRLRSLAGLYSPRFIALLACAHLARRWDSAWYFRLEDYAMRHLIEFGPLWRFSYIVVASGHRTN